MAAISLSMSIENALVPVLPFCPLLMTGIVSRSRMSASVTLLELVVLAIQNSYAVVVVDEAIESIATYAFHALHEPLLR